MLAEASTPAAVVLGVVLTPALVFYAIRQYWSTRVHVARSRLEIKRFEQELDRLQTDNDAATLEVVPNPEPSHAVRVSSDQDRRWAPLRQVFQVTCGLAMPRSFFFALLRPLYPDMVLHGTEAVLQRGRVGGVSSRCTRRGVRPQTLDYTHARSYPVYQPTGRMHWSSTTSTQRVGKKGRRRPGGSSSHARLDPLIGNDALQMGQCPGFMTVGANMALEHCWG